MKIKVVKVYADYDYDYGEYIDCNPQIIEDTPWTEVTKEEFLNLRTYFRKFRLCPGGHTYIILEEANVEELIPLSIAHLLEEANKEEAKMKKKAEKDKATRLKKEEAKKLKDLAKLKALEEKYRK